MKDQVEKAVSQTLSTYQAVTFKRQTVEGEIFFVKVGFIKTPSRFCRHLPQTPHPYVGAKNIYLGGFTQWMVVKTVMKN